MQYHPKNKKNAPKADAPAINIATIIVLMAEGWIMYKVMWQ
jgi:hypothetical protein